MKRRKFILLSAVGAVAISIPSVSCRYRNHALDRTLARPLSLSHICDAKTIREIGTKYREQVNAQTKEPFVTHLLTDTAGKDVPESSDTLLVQSLLDQKIHKDFEKGNTVIVKGWVLSVTEVQQCALFSLGQ